MTDIALISGPDRSQNIIKTLEILKKEIVNRIQKVKQNDYILIKPNLITSKHPTAATSFIAIDTLLNYLRNDIKFSGRIIIGEGTSVGSTHEAFKNYGFDKLTEFYQVELLDLNKDAGIIVDAYDRHSKIIKVQISKIVVNSAYRISLTPIKTHNSVILSLGLENMVNGSLLKGGNRTLNHAYRMIFRKNYQDYKSLISQDYTAHNLSIANIAKKIMPHLSIIDGYEAIERNGPIGGTITNLNFAMSGTDAIAVDSLAAYLVGFDPGKIGYLHHLEATKHEIHLLGNKISECRKKIRPHDTYQDQLKW